MEPVVVYSELKQVFEKLGIEVSERMLDSETGPARSGLARVYQRKIFYLDKALPLEEKIAALVQGLRQFDLSGIYLSPFVRKRIEEWDEAKE